MIGRVLVGMGGSCLSGNVNGAARRGIRIMFDVLKQSERSLLIAMNGEPHFKELNDISLLNLLTEDGIRGTLGNNVRTDELLQIRKESKFEF